MSANSLPNHFRKTVMVIGLATLFTAPNVMAQDWISSVGSSIASYPAVFEDPLHTRPEMLKTGQIQLPGDSPLTPCAVDGRNSLPDAHVPLTLTQAMDIALCHNPQLKGTWAAIKVQAAALGEARAAYLPTLSGSISRLRDHTHTPNNAFQPSTTLKNTTQYASLSWRLLDFGGRAANQRSAIDLLNAAEASHNAALQKTLTDVISAYFDAQTAQATWLSKQKIEGYAKATFDTAQRRETRGAGAESDTLQAQTALSKAMLERSRAQGGYQKALSVLIYALGIPETTQLTLGEDLTDQTSALKQDLSAWLAQAQAMHPAILAAQAQLASAREKIISTRSEGLPSLDLTANYYQNGRPNQGLNSTKTQETLAGITLNIPIFSGFSQTYKIRGAEAQAEQKQAELEDTENQILREVVKAHADASAALDNLQYSENLLTAAQRAVATVQRKYDKGASDILEILNTQSSLSDAEQERIQSLADWRSARLRLLTSVGVLGMQEMGR
ncbi:TolC family protein [Aquirhabdus sp.]|uniref:TolC family protein n=1 Tax=Aquirhabdus sp. TaxID=2824160 RepID=UPI00396CDAAF